MSSRIPTIAKDTPPVKRSYVLQCVALCCSMPQCSALCRSSITFLTTFVLKSRALSFSPPIHLSLSYSLSNSHSLFPLAFFVPQSFPLPDLVPFHFPPPLLISPPTPSHRIPRQSRADARLLRGVAGKLESTPPPFLTCLFSLARQCVCAHQSHTRESHETRSPGVAGKLESTQGLF